MEHWDRTVTGGKSKDMVLLKYRGLGSTNERE